MTKAQYTEGKVSKILLKYSIPMYFGILSAIAFNLVDTYFLSLLGTNELAAITYTFPIIYIVTGVTMGIGTGATTVISKAIGAGDQEKVIRFTTHSLILATVIVFILTIIGHFTIELIFPLMGAKGQILQLVKEYMTIWYYGVVFLVIPMVGNSAIRATGDTKTPSIIMMIAVVMNLILDPIFIFGFGPIEGMGMAGAAVATVIARALTLVISLYVLTFREKIVRYGLRTLKNFGNSVKEILHIGIPSSISSITIPIAIATITSIVAQYGEHAVASLGVALRIEAFALTVFMALGSVLAPFFGQNLGAGHHGRVLEAVKISRNFALAWGVFSAIVLAVFAYPIGYIFSDSPELVDILSLYLYIGPISYGLRGLVMITNISFNVIKMPIQAAAIILIHAFAVLTPLAYLGSSLFGIVGVFYAISVANILIGLYSHFWLIRILRERKYRI